MNPSLIKLGGDCSLAAERLGFGFPSVSICVHPWLKLFLLVFSLNFAVQTRAAENGNGDYLIDVWTRERGLPSSSVTAIAQTQDGYLWIGTYNGLARFDGERCVNYFPENTPELKNARVRKLFATADGTLWINTYDGSITSFRGGRFTLEWLGSGSADAVVTLFSTASKFFPMSRHSF